MQFKVNKGWTCVRILRYLENDKVKRHSVVECLGSIPLAPELPEAIPESVLARMTPAQQDETRTKLGAIRAKRPAFVLERAAVEATLALGEVLMAARPGLTLQAYAADGLRTALVEVSNALPDLYPASGTVALSPSKSQDSVGAAMKDFGNVPAIPTSVSVLVAPAQSGDKCPVSTALAATNALVDATGAGLEVSPDQVKELQVQLALICNLYGDQRGGGAAISSGLQQSINEQPTVDVKLDVVSSR